MPENALTMLHHSLATLPVVVALLIAIAAVAAAVNAVGDDNK